MAGGVKRQSSSPWADLLPLDIISLIANSLHYIDQVSFRAVCKSWRAAYIVRYADKLPWLVFYDLQFCHLYDPSNKRKYSVSKSAAGLQKFTRKRLLDTKHDWVLSRGEKKGGVNVLFFHNPFTDNIIELPAFDNKPTIELATFSTTPISPDCVIFALCRFRRMQYRIIINRPNNNNNRDCIEFDIEGEHDRVQSFVHVDGFLFYSFRSPRLFIGAFDVASAKWHILPHPPSQLLPRSHLNMIIDSDGELLICYNSDHVYRLNRNRSQMNWCEIDRFEGDDDRALFITCWYSRIWVPVEKGSELANTIHFFHYNTAHDVSYKIRSGVSIATEFSPKINAYDDWENRCVRRYKIRSGVTTEFSPMINASADHAYWIISRLGWIQPPQTGQ